MHALNGGNVAPSRALLINKMIKPIVQISNKLKDYFILYSDECELQFSTRTALCHFAI